MGARVPRGGARAPTCMSFLRQSVLAGVFCSRGTKGLVVLRRPRRVRFQIIARNPEVVRTFGARQRKGHPRSA
eukprot:1733841-Lingulodinium_polyedra.AAC.1